MVPDFVTLSGLAMSAVDGIRLAGFGSVNTAILAFFTNLTICELHHIYRKLFDLVAQHFVRCRLVAIISTDDTCDTMQ